ncbi:Uncharacterised protein [Mycobacterium tuberculosis]|nr:Uncharacterised protein [Mycobacterium tuberculosis]
MPGRFINRETRDRDSVGSTAQRNIQTERINTESLDARLQGAAGQRDA